LLPKEKPALDPPALDPPPPPKRPPDAGAVDVLLLPEAPEELGVPKLNDMPGKSLGITRMRWVLEPLATSGCEVIETC